MNLRSLRILPLLVSLAVLGACPDDGTDDASPATDAGQQLPDGGTKPDAGTQTDAGGEEPVDAGTQTDAGTPPITSCDQVDGTCTINSACELSEHCTSFGTDPARCCVPGARGTAETGASCTKHEDCSFGYCTARDDGQKFCSGECEVDDDCPIATMFCGMMGWCAPRDANSQPEDCYQLSLDQCYSNEGCFSNERCEDMDTTAEREVFCCTEGPRGEEPTGSECASELECAYGRCIDGMCTGDCDPYADPTGCPETMVCDDYRNLCVPPAR